MEIISQKIIRLAYVITFAVITSFFALTCSEAPAQDSSQYTFSQDVPERTITFRTTNPYAKTPGAMTITLSGVFHAIRLTEPDKLGMAEITGNQKGTFAFVPEGASQPAISGEFVCWVKGSTQSNTDTIDFNFIMNGSAQDGSRVAFLQAEQAWINEAGVKITFGETKTPEGSNLGSNPATVPSDEDVKAGVQKREENKSHEGSKKKHQQRVRSK